MTTGWFGIPGKRPRDPKVHLVYGGRATLCGWTPSEAYEYQVCVNLAKLDLVECERCKTAYAALELEGGK